MDKASRNPRRFKHYLALLTIISLFLIGCSSTQRFSKEDEDSNSRYERSKSSEEFDNTGLETTNGEIYNMYDLTAAHKTYPFNTIVRVTNLSTGKSVRLRINDRMPDYNPRIIDISYGAAIKLDMLTSGIAEVKLEVLKWGK